LNLIGLDLGTNTFKAVEISRDSKGAFGLVEFAYGPASKSSILSESKESLGDYSNHLKDFIRSHSFTTRNVVVSLPESQVFSRVISMPKMSEKELSSAISYEAQQYIPVPIESVNLDYKVIDTKEKMEVLLVAAPISLIKKYLKVLESASLTAVGMEPETASIVRSSVSGAPFSGATLILNIGGGMTELAIAFKDNVRFSRGIATGGTALSRAISQELGFEMSQAEEYKKSYGLDETELEGKVVKVLKPVFDVIVGDIRRAIAYFNSHNQEIPIRRTVICGGSSLIPGILVYLAKELNMEVQLANPFREVSVGAKFPKEKIADLEPIFSVAVGLAMKET